MKDDYNRTKVLPGDYSHDITMSTDGIRSQTAFMNQVYAWMFCGLILTGAAAFFTARSETLMNLIYGNKLIWVLCIAELLLVLGLTAMIHRISPFTAAVGYILFAALNGLTLASIFWIYTSATLATAFFITAGTFGVMSLFGFATKIDLSGLGRFFLFALVGLILSLVINIFWQNSLADLVLSGIGVLLFAALTAYDTQKLKAMAAETDAASDTGKRYALMGALALYLDFINLFLFILRIFGGKR